LLDVRPPFGVASVRILGLKEAAGVPKPQAVL
jgi:hypothetical protein